MALKLDELSAAQKVMLVVGAFVAIWAFGHLSGNADRVSESEQAQAPQGAPPAAASVQGAGRPAPLQVAPGPQYLVKVVSVECRGDYGRDRAHITVVNVGANVIPYAKAFVQFEGKGGTIASAQDSYLSPSTIPVGATASTTVYSSGGGASGCRLTSVQDGDGNAVQLQ